MRAQLTFLSQGSKWRQVCLSHPGFGHDARMTFVPFIRRAAGPENFKIWFLHFRAIWTICYMRYLTMWAKLGTLWAIIRHYVPHEIPNLSFDARFWCRIVRRFFWYRSCPCCGKGPEIMADFPLWPDFWAWYPGKSEPIKPFGQSTYCLLSNEVSHVQVRRVV